MNILTDSSTLVLALTAAAVALVVAVARWQSSIEHAEAEKPFQQEWEESGWRSLHRGEYQLCRIMPLESWPRAEFTFQDERRAELGRFRGRSRKAITIEYGRRQGGEVSAPPSPGNGLVHGASKRSIVIRDGNHQIAEAFRQAGLARTLFRLLWQQREYRIEKKRWPRRGSSYVRCDQDLIGVFRRTGKLSRKTLFALRSNLPDELKVCLCSLAVLE